MKSLDVNLENHGTDITDLVKNAPKVTLSVTAHHKVGVVDLCSNNETGALVHLTRMSLETARDLAESIQNEIAKKSKVKRGKVIQFLKN
jgi:hypothetical protein